MWKLGLVLLWSLLLSAAACHEESRLQCEPDTAASGGECIPVGEVTADVASDAETSEVLDAAEDSGTLADADVADVADTETGEDATDTHASDDGDAQIDAAADAGDADVDVVDDTGQPDADGADGADGDGAVSDGTSGDGATSDVGPSDGGSTTANTSPFNPNPVCLAVDKVDASTIVPPSGVRVTFRVLDCDGNPVRPLEDGNVTVINDESGKDFNDSNEGGSASPQQVGEDTELFTVLTLDLSNSIVDPDNTGATCADTATCVAMIISATKWC